MTAFQSTTRELAVSVYLRAHLQYAPYLVCALLRILKVPAGSLES